MPTPDIEIRAATRDDAAEVAAMAFYESPGGEYLDEEHFMCWRAPNWPR